jgi:hypothetical protein
MGANLSKTSYSLLVEGAKLKEIPDSQSKVFGKQKIHPGKTGMDFI